VTIRYDADGNQLWVARFDGDSPDLLDLPFAVAADVGGTYVAASSFITHEDSQYVTLKYDAAGSLLWQVALNAAPGMQDEPRAMVLDRAGNVYMTGRSEDPLNREQFVTVKYDAHGKEVWSQAIIGGSPFDLAVTGDGAVTVAGNHGPLGSPSYAVARYDGEGRQEWFLRYPGSAAAMAVDEEGGAYLTGNSSSPNSQGGIDRYIATLKYSARGDLVWEARREEGGAVRLALDGNGSLYVLGYAQTGTQPGTFESFILKYDVAGRFQWSKRYRERGFERTIATRIAARGGRVYLAGSVGDDLSYPGILAAVFDGDGNFQGSGSHLGADGLGASAATFAVDGAGGVVIAGFVGRRPASSDLIVLKYEPRAEPSFRRGDTNGDGAFDLSDPVLVLLHLFLGMTPPACMKSADVDDSSRLDVTDAIQALNFLFLGGPPPAPPYPDCGDDPTRDGLGCQAYAPCS
jgi:hypothetical protein